MALLPETRFTDREHPKDLFREHLITPQAPDEYRLLTFYGVGGQGKSALYYYFQDQGNLDQEKNTFSKWLQSKGEFPKYKIASVSFDDPQFQQSHEALMEIRQGFLGCGIDFFNFDLAFTYYMQKAYPIVDMKKRYSKLFRSESEWLFDLFNIVEAGANVAGPNGAIFGAGITILSIIGKHLYRFKPKFNLWYQREGQALARQLQHINPQDLLEKLPQYLAKDLQEALKDDSTPRLVIMLDTYEALWGKSIPSVGVGTGFTDEWVRDLVSACPGVLLVIFGRESLNWDKFSKDRKSRNYTAMLEGQQHLLGEFSDSDADLFLRTAGLNKHGNDIEIRKRIIRSSKGLPFYLAVQLETYNEILAGGERPRPDDFGGTEYQILERFLRHLNDHQRDALLVLGQSQILNADIFDLLKTCFFNGSPVQFKSLINHSFIQSSPQPDQYRLHQLMQEHLQGHLKQDDPARFQRVHQVLFDYYDQLAQVEDIKTIGQVQERSLIEAAYHKKHFDLDNYSVWLYERTQPFRQAARYSLLIPLYEDLLSLSKQTVGEDRPDYATHLNSLADLLESLGRYEEAERLYRQAIEIAKKTLGEDHPNYAISLNNLANLLNSLGRYEEAERLFRRAIEIGKKTLGEDHPNYAISLNNLAGLLKNLGCYEEAEQLFRQAIEIDKKTIGEDHPNYAAHLNNLANLLSSLGRYEEAERLYRQAIEIGKKTLGEDHPNYAISLDNLANSLRNLGRYEEAERLHRQAIEVTKKTIGEDHPNYAVRLNNLANSLRSLGRYEEAERLHRQAIEVTKKTIGEDHPNYVISLDNLGGLLSSLGRYEEAERLFRQAIEIGKKTIGEDHPAYAISLNNLANLLTNLGRYEEAEPLYRQAIQVFESSLGSSHPDTITAKQNYQSLLDARSKQNTPKKIKKMPKKSPKQQP